MKKVAFLSVFLTVIAILNAYSQKAPSEIDFESYLFAYFEGSGKKPEQEQLRLAVSSDAQNCLR